MQTLPFTYCRAVAPLALALLLLSGCGGGSGAGSAALPDSAKTALTSTRETPTTDEATNGPTTTTTLLVPDSSAAVVVPDAGATASPPGGKLVVRLPPNASTDQNHRLAYQFVAALLPAFADKINAQLGLPRDVVLTMSDSEELNAYYSASTHSITVNYGLILYAATQVHEGTARGGASGGDGAAQNAAGVLLFVLYHELGHCLIHECDLPVPGREEDDADQLATLFMTRERTPAMGRSLAAAAVFFAQMSETDAANIAWDDSHSIGQQRAYNILGWLYGSDPARMRGLVDNKVLSAERAQDGIEEYRRIKRAWANYLQPYLKS